MKEKGLFAVILVLILLVALTGGISSPSVATASGQDRPLGDSIKDQTSSLEEPAIYVTCDSGTDISDEIQAAVDTLRELGGGTIYLPEGDFLFATPVGTRPQSMMPGGINVIGQGIDKTILRHTVDRSSFFDINHWGYAGGAFRISGISFYGVPAAVGLTSGGIRINNIVDFRIDHCHFERILYNIGVNSRADYPQSRGVVDHCSFIAAGLGTVYGVYDSRVWQEDMKLGTAEATFIEDCYMEDLGHPGASFGGGHYVLRHNEIVDSDSIDAHGPGFDSSMRGARATEIYGNTIYQRPDEHGWTAVGLRAGGGVIFNNTFQNYDHAVRFSIDTYGYNATGGTYPTLDQVTDMWIWDNTLIDIVYDPNAPGYQDDLSNPSRSIVSGVLLYSNNAGVLIQKDRDFHMRAPSLAQDGFTYTPYTYPHPLTQELILNDTPADQAIHLNWDVNSSLQITGWQLAYQGPTGDQASPITSIISPTQAFTLTGLTNYVPYTITLNAMVDTTPVLTATAYAIPTDISVYLPLVQQDAASPLLVSSLGTFTSSAVTGGGQGLGRSSIDAAPQPSHATWSQAGYPGEIPYSKDNVTNVKDAGAVGDGATNDYAAIQAAIDGASAPAVIFFPAGRYRFESRLELKSGIVLRGEGYKLTHLECLNTSGCINMTGSRTGGFVDIQSGLAKGSNQIVVADASGFTVGQGGEIQQDDIVPAKASWGENAVGQMVKILAINGNTLTIDPPLHINYSLSKNPIIRPIRYVEQVGIEDLHLKRLDSGSEGGNNISMTRTADCWIRRVESEWTEKYHIAVSESLHLEVRDSYIHHAYYIGDGGQGYGVSLAHQATSILVENNIFNELRHSMIIQLGTNGCVFGYNYAQRNYSDDGWDKSYISVHGHYPFMNLFEGNIVGWAVMDSYWGANGPDNTFFRNRVVGTDKHQEFGPYRGIWVSGFHGPQYIVGNEIQGQDGVYIYSPTGDPDDIVIHGNNVLGVVTWDPAIPDHTLPASYYLASKPGFYGEMEWPSMGGDKTIGEGKIPALVRWQTGDYIPSPAESALTLDLSSTPANEAIHLTWTVSGTLPTTGTWRIDYDGPTGDQPSPITGIANPTRAYTLTGLTNYARYTVTLGAMVDGTSVLSDTATALPTDKFIYLPLVLKE